MERYAGACFQDRVRYADRWRRTGSGRKRTDGASAYFSALQDGAKSENGVYHTDKIYVCNNKVAQPHVFIPVFPGTNCEYDSAKAFERAGAEVDSKGIPQPEAQKISVSR